jgi:hypothetical protein
VAKKIDDAVRNDGAPHNVHRYLIIHTAPDQAARAVFGPARAFVSALNDFDRVFAHPAGAIVMANPNKIFASDQLRGDTGVCVNAAIIVFCDESGLAVWAEELHDYIRRAASIDDVTSVARRGEPE